MGKQDFENFSLKLASPISSKTRRFFTGNLLKQWNFSNYYKYYITNIFKGTKFITIATSYEDDLNWLLSLKILPQAVRSIVGRELDCYKKKTVEVLKQEVKKQEKQPATFTFNGNIHNQQVNVGSFETEPVFSASGPNDKNNTKKRTWDAIEDDDLTFLSNEKQNDIRMENQIDSSECVDDVNQKEKSEEEERKNIDNDYISKVSRNIFDLDDESITVTESQQLDINEIIPSTAKPTSPSIPPSITRSLLFNWAFKLYLNKSVTIPVTTLAVIRDHDQQSVANRLMKLSADLLAGWSTTSVDDDYRYTLSLGLSLIVDVSNNKASKKLLSCLSNSQVQDIKSHVKKEKEKMNKLPENILSIFREAFELFSTSDKHDALLYLTKIELKELEEKEDNITLQSIEVLKYIIRNVEKWSNDDKSTEVDWTHRLVPLLDILLRDSSLSIRMGEKASLVTKVIRQENELRFGNKGKAESTIGRKIDVITEHDGLELSASEWKSFKSGDSVINKQHNKNLRVNACVLLQLLQLPYNNNNNNNDSNNVDRDEVFNLGVLTMEWRGAEGDLISIKKVNEHYVSCKIGRMYLPTSVDDIHDFYVTLELLLYWKEFHLRLQNLIKAPLARFKRLKRDSCYQTSRKEEPTTFFTPTRDDASK